jgi:hypothetical protein
MIRQWGIGILCLGMAAVVMHLNQCVSLYDQYHQAQRRRDAQICRHALEIGLIEVCQQDHILLQSSWAMVIACHLVRHTSELVMGAVTWLPLACLHLVRCSPGDTYCVYTQARLMDAVVDWVSVTWLMVPIIILLLFVVIIRQLTRYHRWYSSAHALPVPATWPPASTFNPSLTQPPHLNMHRYLTTAARCPARLQHDHLD